MYFPPIPESEDIRKMCEGVEPFKLCNKPDLQKWRDERDEEVRLKKNKDHEVALSMVSYVVNENLLKNHRDSSFVRINQGLCPFPEKIVNELQKNGYFVETEYGSIVRFDIYMDKPPEVKVEKKEPKEVIEPKGFFQKIFKWDKNE